MNRILSQNIKKLKGNPLGKQSFFENSLTIPKKNRKGAPFSFSSTGMACHAEKEEKLFWFSSLVQMIQFGTMKFCRTFKNYFGQLLD